VYYSPKGRQVWQTISGPLRRRRSQHSIPMSMRWCTNCSRACKPSYVLSCGGCTSWVRLRSVTFIRRGATSTSTSSRSAHSRMRSLPRCGPDPSSLLDPVNPDDLRQASAAIVERWRDQAHRDREWVAWLRAPDTHTFVVLTLCTLSKIGYISHKFKWPISRRSRLLRLLPGDSSGYVVLIDHDTQLL
jgi:hypothetical protein